MSEVKVKIAGASYDGVPAILIPLQDGGNAKFCEVSDTTATAGDVVKGKSFYAADGTKTTGTLTATADTTYAITLPETEHQTVTATVAYKGTVPADRAFTASGTVTKQRTMDLIPTIIDVTVKADTGYIAGTVSPTLAYPYTMTGDIAFSVSDAVKGKLTFPDTLTFTLNGKSTSQNTTNGIWLTDDLNLEYATNSFYEQSSSSNDAIKFIRCAAGRSDVYYFIGFMYENAFDDLGVKLNITITTPGGETKTINDAVFGYNEQEQLGYGNLIRNMIFTEYYLDSKFIANGTVFTVERV